MLDADRVARAADAARDRETEEHFQDADDLECVTVDCDATTDKAGAVCDGCKESRAELLREAASLFDDEWLTQQLLVALVVRAEDGTRLADFWQYAAPSLIASER